MVESVDFEVWDISNGEKADKFRIPKKIQRKIPAGAKMNDVLVLKFSPDGHYLAILDNYSAEIWDFQAGIPITADGGYIWIDNERYFKKTRDGFPVVVDMKSGKEESKKKIYTLALDDGEKVKSIAYSPDCNIFVHHCII